MENEVKEVLDEELGNELGNVNRKSSKVKILGIATVTAVTAVLLKFRNKINARIERKMVNKLTKKGYSVISPVDSEKIADELLESFS